jgi:hypothetical protein
MVLAAGETVPALAVLDHRAPDALVTTLLNMAYDRLVIKYSQFVDGNRAY